MQKQHLFLENLNYQSIPYEGVIRISENLFLLVLEFYLGLILEFLKILFSAFQVCSMQYFVVIIQSIFFCHLLKELTIENLEKSFCAIDQRALLWNYFQIFPVIQEAQNLLTMDLSHLTFLLFDLCMHE